MSEIETTANNSSKKGFFVKLLNGDYGLAKTYWLYGVMVGIVVSIIMNASTSNDFKVAITVPYVTYCVPVIMGLWNSANKYQGPKVWAVMGKVSAVFTAFQMLLFVFAIFALIGKM